MTIDSRHAWGQPPPLQPLWWLFDVCIDASRRCDGRCTLRRSTPSAESSLIRTPLASVYILKKLAVDLLDAPKRAAHSLANSQCFEHAGGGGGRGAAMPVFRHVYIDTSRGRTGRCTYPRIAPGGARFPCLASLCFLDSRPQGTRKKLATSPYRCFTIFHCNQVFPAVFQLYIDKRSVCASTRGAAPTPPPPPLRWIF